MKINKETIGDLIKITVDPQTGKLTANWQDIPRGSWTKDITWTGNPDDEELATLAILAHRNLKKRVVSLPEPCVKVWGIGEGFKLTLAYNSDQDPANKVDEIGRIAVLLSTMPIPRNK